MRGGKNEEWVVTLGGQPLIGAHPTFADQGSVQVYIELLQEEVRSGSFTLNGYIDTIPF
jgi:hypothetical protein